MRDSPDLVLRLPDPGWNWIVLHTRPRCEKKLELFSRTQGWPVYLPLRRKVHRYGNRTRTFWLPLFPGYVFCMVTPYARSILKQNRYVANVLDVLDQERLVAQLQQIRAALAVDDVVEVMPYLVKGRWVRVTGGPFRGLEGVVARIKGRTTVVLNVDMIRQSVCVEVDSSYLEPA